MSGKDMKNIYMYMMSLVLAFSAFTGCTSKEEPFFTATEDDYPRILNTDIPEWKDGVPQTLLTIYRDANFEFDVVVTPADYTTVEWFLDDVKIAEGKSINQPVHAGTWTVKILATTTKGLQTSRTAMLVVHPCEGDPVPADDVLERLVAPGFAASLRGENMDKVAKVVIGGVEVDAAYSGGAVTYTVPAGVADGRYLLTVKDASGYEYGAGYITVSSLPTVSAAAFTGKSGAFVTISGKNLDKIASVAIGGKAAEVSAKDATSLTFTVPELEAGIHEMSAKSDDGSAVKFINGSELSETAAFTVAAETVLWEGRHYVSWSLADGDPNKTFSALAADSKGWKAGEILKVYLEVKADDEYHQVQFNSMWWTQLPGTAKADFATDTVFEISLTQEQIDLINAQDGFIICGHGFYVTKVTIE